MRKFTDVIELRQNRNAEDILHIYGNDEVDAAGVKSIIESGKWDALQSIDGFFAGVYQTRDTIYLFCDRIGLHPLFYYKRQDCLFVSPSVPDMLRVARHEPGHCLEGVISLLLFGHHIADETVMDRVKRCKNGTTVRIETAEDKTNEIVWMAEHIYQDTSSITASEMGDLFVKEVERCIGNRKDIAIALSGGFDSRAVLGALLECVGPERIQTLTFGDKDAYDRRIAEMVAKKAGVKSSIFRVEDQIFSDDFLRERSGNYGYSYSAFATQPEGMLSYISDISSRGYLTFWGGGGDAISGSHLLAGDINLEPCESSESLAGLLIEKRCFLPLHIVSKIIGLEENEVISIVGRLIEKCVPGRYDKPWKFLDAWDIYIRGRLELISVLPLRHRTWRCPLFGREYFLQMSTQCFHEKYNQNMYRKMLSSRFSFLFSLPTRRLKGRSLVGGQLQSLPWIVRWRAGRLPQAVKEIVLHRADSVGRKYGKNLSYLTGKGGKNRLRESIDILTYKSVLPDKSEELLEISSENAQAALMLITLGYAFEPRQ